jgi:pimeloyl-ACP methyl ester carboxylesterase
MRCILLPGLDGSGRLFGPFLAALPSHVEAQPLAYPAELTTYPELVEWTLAQLPDTPCGVIAESFSGPIALQCSARRPEVIRRAVLTCTFISSPVPRLVGWLPQQTILSLPLPTPAARFFLVGSSASPDLVRETISTIRAAPPRTLAGRIRSVLSLSPSQFSTFSQPILYLQASSDRLVPRRCGEELRRHYPQTVLRPIDGPHFLLQARPADCVEAIEGFLDG